MASQVVSGTVRARGRRLSAIRRWKNVPILAIMQRLPLPDSLAEPLRNRRTFLP
jgi:hypothetical protein